MSFADVERKTNISGQFSASDKATILAAMRTAYEGSATAKAMFDSWIAVPGKTITIDSVIGQFRAYRNTGKLEIDLSNLTAAMYIDNFGTAAKDTAVTAIVHELVHALTGRSDNTQLITGGATNDYRQPTVTFANVIYRELGLPEQNSYVGYDAGGILTFGFQYTQGAPIDRSVVGYSTWDSSPAGNSNDLLIGGGGNNKLSAGDGNDYLYGNGGNDTLDGGTGADKLYGGVGNDILSGGTGGDTYSYQSGDGTDTLTDTDGLNKIVVGATQLTGTSEKPTLGAGNTHTWTANSGEYEYQFDANRKSLTLSGSALGGAGNSITLTDIADLKALKNRYGIDLKLNPEIALTTESGNVFADPGYTPSALTENIGEYASRFLNIALNQALKAGDKIKLAIDSISGVAQSAIKAVTGDQVLGFDSGSLTLTAAEGQNLLSLAILEDEDISADASVIFKATIETTDETGAAVTVESNLFTLNIQDSSGEAPGDIQTTNTINGDLNPKLDGNNRPVIDQWDNIVSDGQPAPDRVDFISDTTANDLIDAGGGNDTVYKRRGGDDIIKLSAGDDTLITNWDAAGRVIASGGDGRDYLGAGSGRDVIEGGADADALYGSSENDRLYGDAKGNAADFIAAGAAQQGSGQQGEWIDAEDGDDQMFTGEANDFVAGGGGAFLPPMAYVVLIPRPTRNMVHA